MTNARFETGHLHQPYMGKNNQEANAMEEHGMKGKNYRIKVEPIEQDTDYREIPQELRGG